jgi:hypothetical protein
MGNINTNIPALEQCKGSLQNFIASQSESLSRINSMISAIHDSGWTDKRANDIVGVLEGVKSNLQTLGPELEKGVADIAKLIEIAQAYLGH